MGGTSGGALDCASNALDLCQKCHDFIESHPAFARSRGWLVRSPDTSGVAPVLYRARWVVLSDDGTTSRTDQRPSA